jgi:hypothetical protein
MAGPGEYIAVNPPSAAQWSGPGSQIGLALGDRIANLSQRFEAGREIGFHEALRQAFPDGLPTRPDGTIDAAGIVNKIRARSLPCSPWRRGNRWPGWCRQMPAA